MSNEEGGLQSPTTDSSNVLLASMVQKIALLTEVVQDTRMQLSVKKTPELQFKHKGNRIQHTVNADVLTTLSSALTYADQGKLPKAVEFINEGIEQLEKRNKMILIADSSECGWDTVNYFQKPEFLDNEDEVAKLKTANMLAKADKKRKLEDNKGAKATAFNANNKKHKGFSNNDFYQQRMNSQSANQFGLPSGMQFSNIVPNMAMPAFFGAGPVPGPSYSPRPVYTPRPFAPRQCYACGEWGHMQSSCPKRAALQANIASNRVSLVIGNKCCIKQNFTANILVPIFSIKGNLLKHALWWEKHASPWIYDIIMHGLQLPFGQVPPQSETKNNKSALDNCHFVETELKHLLSNQIISECEFKPIVINPLTVATNSTGKNRLVIDLRYVNPYITVPKTVFESLNTAAIYLNKECFLNKFDLKSGYHHIDIHKNFKPFLGFQWSFDDKSRYFQFNALPFGLNIAGYIFTKVLRTLVKKWRKEGIKIVLYLDDGLLISDTEKQAVKNVINIRKDLKDAGLIVNEDKSNWLPSQELIWLGFIINSKNNSISVPCSKISNIKAEIKHLTLKKTLSARQLARVIGKITALHPVLGGIVYLKSKNCQLWISEQLSWESKNVLDYLAKEELQFWVNNLNHTQSKSMEISVPSFTKIVYTDAGANNCGGYIHNLGASQLVQQWSEQEQAQSSTWRELKAVEIFLCVHHSILNSQNIKWFTDNQNVIAILNKGSMKKDLNSLATAIYKLCLEHAIDITLEWVPRQFNEQADFLSKVIDQDDWSITDNVFQLYEKQFGGFTIDLFANDKNKKCKKFYSKWWCLGTSGMDAFAYDWSNEFCWAVPPPSLISKALIHAKKCKADCLFVVPKWEASPFWPLITHMLYAEELTQINEFCKPAHFFRKGRGNNAMFTVDACTFNVVVYRTKNYKYI